MPSTPKQSGTGNENEKGVKSNDFLQTIAPEALAENLYKKNIELLTRNKTLSLLRELYEISILTLSPEELAERISNIVRIELGFELVGILMLTRDSSTLIPLALSQSEKVKNTLSKLSCSLEELKIPLSSEIFFTQVIHAGKEKITNNLDEVWKGLINPKKIQKIAEEDHIKTTLVFPLKVENKILGIIFLALNRSYEELSSFEKESVASFINVIALALEKASLYQELKIANEQLRELDLQKDELLGIIAHQLATPISSVRWNLEMMMDGDMGKLSKEQKESIKSLQGITENLSDLVSMILDVSRIQLGRMKVDPQELDLDQFFKEILEVITPKAKEKKIKFNIELPKKFPKAVLDKRYTHMTIENLLSNAVKYTPQGGMIDFEVKIKDRVIFCSVKDTGIGIPKQEQDKIFGKMYRATNVRNTVDGNGFGLYVAKGAIEAQEGKIWFKSIEGKGTTFFVELPLKKVFRKEDKLNKA